MRLEAPGSPLPQFMVTPNHPLEEPPRNGQNSLNSSGLVPSLTKNDTTIPTTYTHNSSLPDATSRHYTIALREQLRHAVHGLPGASRR